MSDTAPATETAGLQNEALDKFEADVSKIIEEIRPAVQSDGGDLELVRVDPAGIVHVRLHGSCVGCPSSEATLRMGVENYLREELPEFKGLNYIQ